MKSSCSCNDLMLKIQQIGFVLVDLNLYLDTHPDCKMALDDFNRLSERFMQLQSAYEKQYGPLKNFGQSLSDSTWQWVDESQPWPWENKRRCA